MWHLCSNICEPMVQEQNVLPTKEIDEDVGVERIAPFARRLAGTPLDAALSVAVVVCRCRLHVHLGLCLLPAARPLALRHRYRAWTIKGIPGVLDAR